jgi:hypothetical protein
MAGEVNYGLVNPAVLDYAGQEQKTLNVQKSRLDVQRLEEERKLMLGMQKQLADSGQDPDLNIVFDTMIKSGNPDYMSKGIEGKAKLKEQQDFAKIMGYGDTATPPAPTAPGSFGTPMAPAAPEATAPGAAPAPTNALTAMPGARPAAPANALATSALNQAETADKINRLLATGNPRAIQAAQVLQSQLKTEAPRAGIVVGAKGTLVNPVTGEVIFRNTAGSGEGGAAADLGLSKKDLQKREMMFPVATQAVETFEAKTDQLEKDLEALKNHPGLSSITGLVAGRAPAVTKDGRAAQALYDKIVARGGFKELQDMRAASPTGGALGNVSNQEGTQLRQSFAAIDRRQDASDVQSAIDQAVTDLQGSKRRVREAYDMTYEYKAPRGSKAPPKAPGAGGNTVTTPDGKVLTFPTAEAAAQFKKAANIKD